MKVIRMDSGVNKKSTAKERYDKAKTKVYGVKVVIPTEPDIYDKLESTPNKSGYIKNLIRADLAKLRCKEKKGAPTMKKYIVLDEMKAGDTFEAVHDTLEAANRDAAEQWAGLTRVERKRRRISVVVVTEEDLTDWAIQEDGSIDWTAYHSADSDDSCFDSARQGSAEEVEA